MLLYIRNALAILYRRFVVLPGRFFSIYREAYDDDDGITARSRIRREHSASLEEDDPRFICDWNYYFYGRIGFSSERS